MRNVDVGRFNIAKRDYTVRSIFRNVHLACRLVIHCRARDLLYDIAERTAEN